MTELVNDTCGVTSASKTLNSMQSRVIPTSNGTIIDELLNLALAQNGVADVEAGVFPHIGLVDIKILKKLIV